MTGATVLIMAGGTGGHVFPALATAECLRARGVDVQWLGTHRGIESRLVPAADIPLHFVDIAGLRGKGLLNLFKAPFQLLKALRQSLAILRAVNPVCVLGMGGFVAGPGGLAAWLTGRPLVIHEQNAVAGTTNRLLARLARTVLAGYPIAVGGMPARFVGNPVRQSIGAMASPSERGVGEHAPLRLLVLGGSLGAQPINELLPNALALIPEHERPAVWHQCGESHYQAVVDLYRQAGIEGKINAFIDDMAAAYGWADLVVCRAGALTVAEIAAAGVASVLVPLPHAIDDHQTFNARWLADIGAARLLPQNQMTTESFAALVRELMRDKEQLLTMASKARAVAKFDAAEQVANCCMEVGHD